MGKDAVLPPVRVELGLLEAARAVALARDESLAQVVRRALRAYVASAPLALDVAAAVADARVSPPAVRRRPKD